MSEDRTVFFAIDWNACIQCGACVAVCPQPAGFTSPFDTIAVHTPCDIACMACEYICPVETISSYKGKESGVRSQGAGSRLSDS